MKLKMAEKSLFAVLLRSPWWVSTLVAIGVFGAARLLLPAAYTAFAAFAALPFAVIACVAGWKQLRAPSGARIEAGLERLRAMPWEAFAAALEEGFRREGYAVTRMGGAMGGTAAGAADFALEKSGRLALAAAKRWKASRTGIEPLRDLYTAGAAREAGECLYLCAGEITANARAYAAQNNIRLLEGLELAKLAGAV